MVSTSTTADITIFIDSVSNGVCTVASDSSATVTVEPEPITNVTSLVGTEVCEGETVIFNIEGEIGSVVTYNLNGAGNREYASRRFAAESLGRK